MIIQTHAWFLLDYSDKACPVSTLIIQTYALVFTVDYSDKACLVSTVDGMIWYKGIVQGQAIACVCGHGGNHLIGRSMTQGPALMHHDHVRRDACVSLPGGGEFAAC